jgi:hypothetical protein
MDFNTMEPFGHCSRFVDRDLNPGRLEYEAELLAALPWRNLLSNYGSKCSVCYRFSSNIAVTVPKALPRPYSLRECIETLAWLCPV